MKHTNFMALLCLCAGVVMLLTASLPRHLSQQQSRQVQSPPTTKAGMIQQVAFAKRAALPKGTQADFVFVDKSERRMYLMKKGKVIRSYHIALGDQPKGHKRQEGDEKTPEGVYTLDWKNENSIAHRSIHISYPNKKDKAQAQKRGVSPGGAIMIHGQMNGMGHLAPVMQKRNWTDGCIAVTNDEMDEVMDLVKVGTKIKIVW